MERHELESKLIDYIDGKLDANESSEVAKWIATDADIATLHEQLRQVIDQMNQAASHEVPTTLASGFHQKLSDAIREESKPKEPQVWIWRMAAALALIAVSTLVVREVIKSREHDQEIAQLRQEMQQQKTDMMKMLVNQQSASQRLMGATVAYEMNNTDDDIIQALANTFENDPNTNVRLTALEALGKFYQQPSVRPLLVKAVTTQKDPVVQIALIRLLVQMKEKGVVRQLEIITRDGNVIRAVKDEAHLGILKLS